MSKKYPLKATQHGGTVEGLPSPRGLDCRGVRGLQQPASGLRGSKENGRVESEINQLQGQPRTIGKIGRERGGDT